MRKHAAMEIFLPEFEWNITTFLFVGFVLFAFMQVLMVLFFYARVAFAKEKKNENESIEGVSVILAARNEAENLIENLPLLLEQDHPNFEVIVVNHQSTDDTFYLLNALQRQYPQLRVINVEKSPHLKYGKKLPLTLGIKGARFENLLLTDADCRPLSDKWLRTMTKQLNDSKEIVLGYGPLRKKRGFLNAFIRFDTAWIALNYFSFAKAGLPYMGVGRNLAYKRTAFDRVSGFKSHYALPSGDDDLFIQEAATRKNTSIVLTPDSFMESPAPTSWESLIRQKTRHFTTSSHYNVFKKALLGIYPLSLLLMLGTFVTLLFDSEFRWLTLTLFVLVLLIKWFIIGKAFAKLKAHGFIKWLPFLDIFYAFWAPILYYSVDKTDTNKW